MTEEREYRKAKGYEIDPATNMPVVPEGHFWRVKFENHGYYRERYSVTVQLRKKHQGFKEWFEYNWFGKSYLVASHSVNLFYHGTKVWDADGYYYLEPVLPKDWAASVKQAYEGVLARLEEYLESLEYQAAAKTAIKELAGDYPPKKLRAI